MIKRLLFFISLCIPSLVFGGVHVQQGDPNLMIGSMTITNGITASSGNITGPSGFTVTYGVSAASGNFTNEVVTSSLNVTGPSGANVTYGLTVGSITVGVTGDSFAQFSYGPSTFTVVSTSGSYSVGNCLVVTSTNATVTGFICATQAGLLAVGVDTGTLRNLIVNIGVSTQTLGANFPVSLSSNVVGNLPVTNLNSGTNADSSHFWRGDGLWISSSTFGGGAGTPGGSNQQLQYNNGGSFAGVTSAVTSSSITIGVPVQFNGTQWIISTGTTLTVQSSTTLNGDVFISSGLLLNLSAGVANDLGQSNGPGYPPTWTHSIVQPTIQVTTLTVTGGAVIPTLSQDFGIMNLNNWFTAIAANQSNPRPGPSKQIAWLGIGDSHMSQNDITRPFIANLQQNFGNAGEWVPLSTFSESTIAMRPNGCTGHTVIGSWSTLPLSVNARGLEDDEVVSVSTGASISSTCSGADQVILHWIAQPAGGTIQFTVDGANTQMINTSSAAIAVASTTISGLGYGTHIASITVYGAGTGSVGIHALDFVFYSSSTPGFINYRAGTNGAVASNYVAQNATLYQNLLGQLPVVPQAVVIAFGTNEDKANVPPSTMINNIHTILGRVRTVYPAIDCAYMSEPDYSGSSSNTYSPAQYATAMSSASIADHCAFIDFTTLFSSYTQFLPYYSDTTHLNTAGGYVAGNLMTNLFNIQTANTMPFTLNTSSTVISWGTNLSTGNYSNVVNFGLNTLISTGATNSTVIGNNLSVSTSGVVVIGGFPGSGNEQNVVTTSVTVNNLAVNSYGSVMQFKVNSNGLVISSGTSPTVSACGTSPSMDAGATNLQGTINTGSASPTACTLTFANGGFTTTPTCVVSDDLQTAEPAITSRSPTAITMTLGAALNSGHLFYICFGGRGN